MFFFIVKYLIYNVVEFVECVEWFFTPQKSTVVSLPGTKKTRAATLTGRGSLQTYMIDTKEKSELESALCRNFSETVRLCLSGRLFFFFRIHAVV